MTKENQPNFFILLLSIKNKGNFFHLQEIISGQLGKWATLISPAEKEGMQTIYETQASYRAINN